MAFLAQDPNQQNQDPNNPQGQVAGAAGQGVTIGGTGGNTSGVLGGSGQSGAVGANSSSGAGNSPKGTSSGSFTNLQNYVTANQGNDAQMGQQVQGMVGGAAGQADQAGSQFQQGAQQKIDSQTVKEDPNMVGSLQKGDTSGVDKDAFGKQWNAGTAYTGPQDASGFDNYGNAKQSYKNVDTYGQEAAGDSSQHQQLLQDTYARNGQQYNQGEGALDSFVLGSGTGGAKALKDINGQYGNYSQNFSNIGNLVNKGVQNAQTTDQNTARDTQAAAKAGFDALQGNLDTAAKQASDANTTAGTLNQQLTTGDASALKAQGLSDQAIQYLQQQQQGGKGYNWSQLVNQPQGQHTAADYANAGDVNNYQNLLGLVNGVAPGTLTAKYGADQLAASGATGPSLKAPDVSAANTISGLNSSLQQALAAKTAQEQAALNATRGGLQGLASGALVQETPAQIQALASQLGVTPDQLNTARSLGVDTTRFLSQGPALTVNDVATADQRGQFNSLANLLGLSGLSASGPNAGPGYRFDTGGLQGAITAAQQAAAARAAPPLAPNTIYQGSGAGQVASAGVGAGSPVNDGGPSNVFQGLSQYVSNGPQNTVNNINKIRNALKP